jgi:hypothetical protein
MVIFLSQTESTPIIFSEKSTIYIYMSLGGKELTIRYSGHCYTRANLWQPQATIGNETADPVCSTWQKNNNKCLYWARKRQRLFMQDPLTDKLWKFGLLQRWVQLFRVSAGELVTTVTLGNYCVPTIHNGNSWRNFHDIVYWVVYWNLFFFSVPIFRGNGM